MASYKILPATLSLSADPVGLVMDVELVKDDGETKSVHTITIPSFDVVSIEEALVRLAKVHNEGGQVTSPSGTAEIRENIVEEAE